MQKQIVTFLLASSLLAACGGGAGKTSEGEKKDSSTAAAATATTTDNKASTTASAPAEAEARSPEAKIKAADEAVKALEAEKLRKGPKKLYRNPDPKQYYDMAYYTGYYRGEELVKIVEEGGEEGYGMETSHYYKDGKPFAQHRKASFMDEPCEDIMIYLENDAPYAAVGVAKKECSDETENFKKLKKGDQMAKIKGLEVSKGIKQTQARFKAAKVEK